MSTIEDTVPLGAQTDSDFEGGMSEKLTFGGGYAHHVQKLLEERVKGTLLVYVART